MSYVGIYSDDGIRIVGPFENDAAAVAWGEKREDPRWFLQPTLDTADFGMIESSPIDVPFVAVQIEDPASA